MNNEESIALLRAKLVTEHSEARDKEIRHSDAYAKQLALQEQGIPCVYCGSTWGHFASCCLLNGGVENQ
jgi:hypothetical protein